MKKIQLCLDAGVLTAVVLALIIPTSALYTNFETENEQLTMVFEEIKEPIKIGGPIEEPKKEMPIQTCTLPKKSTLLVEDKLIYDHPEYTIQNPAITNALNPNKKLIMFEFGESIFENNVGVINSLDGGETFSEEAYYFTTENFLKFPDVDYVGIVEEQDRFVGSAIDEEAVVYIYQINNIEDLSTLSGYSIEWSDNGFSDFQSNDIATHNKLIGYEGTDDYYIAVYVGSFSGISGYPDCEQLPLYMVSSGGTGVYCFWFYYNYSSNVGIDIDQASDVAYYTFQFTNDDNQDVILLSSETQYIGIVEGEGGWGDGMGEGRKYQVTGTANTINPAIAAENDNVYLIMQTDQNGNQDIICYYSKDGGENYEMSVIADSEEDELYPEVYTSGNNAIVVFTKGNNLLSAFTTDGGETWEITQALNDVDGSVVEQTQTAHVYGDKAVWTDGRGQNYAVYIDDVTSSPEPSLVIDEISGGIGVGAVIKNVGTADATNVQWSITLEGLVFLGKDSSGTIPTIAPGDSTQIKSKLPLGFGNINIVISAECDEGVSATITAEAKLLLFFVTGL